MGYIVTPTALPEVLILESPVFADARGNFQESYNQRAFEEATGLATRFVQDNHCRSLGGVLRGLHYQVCQPQGKLVRVVHGEVFDVAVDLRRSSPQFGRWVGVTLSGGNRQQMWIPPGFAHGYYVTSESAELLYKATEYWAPQCERTLAWDDPVIGVDWPLNGVPILADKDSAAPQLHAADTFE